LTKAFPETTLVEPFFGIPTNHVMETRLDRKGRQFPPDQKTGEFSRNSFVSNSIDNNNF